MSAPTWWKTYVTDVVDTVESESESYLETTPRRRAVFKTTEWVENQVFAYEMTSGNFFKAYSERWEVKPTETGSQFSFNDTLVFPYGFFGKVMGWFGERMAKKSSEMILQNLKRLAEA